MKPLLPLLGFLACSCAVAQSYRVGFEMDPSLQAPLEVRFSAEGLQGGESAEWSFGDGSQGRGAQVRHTYYRPGAYTVTVRVLGAAGQSRGHLQKALTVQSAGPERARLVVLPGLGTVRLGSAGSVIYAPSQPRFWLDGREVGPQRLALAPGVHQARVQLAGLTGTAESTVTFQSGPAQTSAAFDTEVLRLTNQARAQGWDCAARRAGGPALAPLRRDTRLEEAALGHALNMAYGKFFEHTSELDGSSASQRIRATGYAASATGENLAGGQETPAEVVKGWLHSPGHCANIMGDFTQLGAVYIRVAGSEYGHYWVQAFGRE
ncbi:CAP domain-containing protein [Deinococcus lacus]|uniref:CAP domain-containing protein n=1 Tax=Deinococcus lacus TaxID=392561 RepID=A0ABW1YGU0_9DEIO